MKIRISRIARAVRKRAQLALSIGALVTGLAITFSVFAATVQTAAAPEDIEELLSDLSLASTVQDNSFIQHNIPETPIAGYLTIEDHTATVTGYSSTSDQTDGDPFVTASNKQVRWGYVAANFLPFGTKVRIPELFGDQVFQVEDRMNRRYTDRMDIWFPSRTRATQFGIGYNIAIQVVEKISK